ncbi:hypothetical protein TRFO_40685 [Tritrichomonas foetus]|uniref:UPF3 domain-containing protein n=1 Tax=Tritrichomonas foetus TaxID=1144522 RepID=A0A1J4J744_9EUKA|nr:hypothetical protein TRFO_40685 [Tritrichomonas foetus]|eukprot:OHS93012.1 hypothetical protein TRFO_40685 [Tritrichomonas foetus]
MFICYKRVKYSKGNFLGDLKITELMNPYPTVRIICRKLPPTLSEEDFCRIDFIRNYINSKVISVKYYQSDLVGDTSAPSSSTAIVTVHDQSTIQLICLNLAQQKFTMSYGEPVLAQIEYAPCQSLNIPYQQPPPQKPLPSIDEDPDFIAFSREFETSFVPPTDALLEQKDVEAEETLDASKMMYHINARMLGKSGPIKKQNNQGNPNKGGNQNKGNHNNNQGGNQDGGNQGRKSKNKGKKKRGGPR